MLGRFIAASSFGLVGLIVSLLAGGGFLVGLAVYCALGSGLLFLICLRKFASDGRSGTPGSWNFPSAGKAVPAANRERHTKKR